MEWHLIIAAIDESPKENEKVFRDYLKSRGFGWWHWINGFWILNATTDYEPKNLSDDLQRFFPDIRHFTTVIHENNPWFGLGPIGENQNMFDWLDKNLSPGLTRVDSNNKPLELKDSP